MVQHLNRSKTGAATATSVVVEAANRLFEAGRDSSPCSPVRDLLPADDIDAAYSVQQYNTERALSTGRRPVGRKIGLTSLAVQKQLGVERPDFGMLFADMCVGEGLPIGAADILQPRIEAEVALVLAKDLGRERHTIADIVGATDFAVPALEIVGSRIANWDISIVDTIADNASSGLFVLGGPIRSLKGLDLGDAATMQMRCDDEIVSEGSGKACLGHPLNAAVWLADEMTRRGQPLRAGDVILTGALGPMAAVKPGNTFSAQISGLGTVTADFEKEVLQ